MQSFYDITALDSLETVAKDILASLPKTDGATVLALYGDLGAGKTTFVQTIATQLGVQEPVTSPTFVIMKGYETTNARWQTLVHIDTYRFDSEEEAVPLHLSQIFADAQTLVCIEWAERIASLLPPHTVHLRFSQQDATRTLTIDL